jgi:hypothetical protein
LNLKLKPRKKITPLRFYHPKGMMRWVNGGRESGREREEEKIKFPVKMNQRKRENGREKKSNVFVPILSRVTS